MLWVFVALVLAGGGYLAWRRGLIAVPGRADAAGGEVRAAREDTPYYGPASVAGSRAPAGRLRAHDKPVAVLEFEEMHGCVPVSRSQVLIGRHSQDDIRINDVRVSRGHALLTMNTAGRFEIYNQTAGRADPNPIRINGAETDHAELADGDTVSLGGVIFRFRLGSTV